MYRIIFTQSTTSFQYYSILITYKIQQLFIYFYKFCSAVLYPPCHCHAVLRINMVVNDILNPLLLLAHTKKFALQNPPPIVLYICLMSQPKHSCIYSANSLLWHISGVGSEHRNNTLSYFPKLFSNSFSAFLSLIKASYCIFLPVNSSLLISVKNLLCRCKPQHMTIFTVAYLFKKISQILALGKSCKLGTIIQSDIYQNLGTEDLTPLSQQQKPPHRRNSPMWGSYLCRLYQYIRH